MVDINELLEYGLWNNSVREYLIALGVFLVLILIFRIFKFFILQKLERLSEMTRTDIDDAFVKVVKSIHWPFYVILSLFIATRFLKLPETADRASYYIIALVIFFYSVRSANIIVDYILHKVAVKRQKEIGDVDSSSLALAGILIKSFTWVIAILFILSNLGYNVNTLIAGLGIAGIAIALATQTVLGDIFASFSIYIDKPFRIGDFIVIGNDSGYVRHIGIKSTRIETLQGEELIVSNKELTGTRVHNFKMMERRRAVFNLPVTFDTPLDKLQKIPEIIEELFRKIEGANLDSIYFTKIGDRALIFEAAYYINTGSYDTYMRLQQTINLEILKKFQKEKIGILH